jgi:signal transduction histidine kinase
MRWSTGWWHRLSLRGRLMLIGTGGLVVGLSIGSVAIIASLGYALQRTVDRNADTTIASIVDQIEQDGQVTKPLPVPAGQVAQVLDSPPSGPRHILAYSANADPLVPLLHADELQAALTRGERIPVPGDRALQDDELRVSARRAADGEVVVVAVSIGGYNESVSQLRTVLFVFEPILVLVLVLAAWRVLGASLRPVESLRAGAERITGADTEERLPVPASHDEIHRLAVTLNDMIDRLSRARARQRAFVADAAHELRSPLASIRVQLEVAQRLGDWNSVGDDILVDVERLSRLVDDLLLLARADDGGPAPTRRRNVQPVDLRGVLTDIAARYSSARVPVSVVDGPPVDVPGNLDELARMVINLVDNAVRHARTRVSMSVTRDGTDAVVCVSDDGPGIPAADRARVFERFTRLDDARARDAGGSGLGLPIVRELARRHGGHVVLSDAAPGLRAEVRLPSASEGSPSAATEGAIPHE